MTLSDCVLFPQAILPLHIFEPRYRAMVSDVLETHRLFAIVGLDESATLDDDSTEPPYGVATVGIIRACQHNPDDTSNLVLQGLARVRIEKIVSETPYRTVEITALQTVAGNELTELRKVQSRITTLLRERNSLKDDVSDEFIKFLGTVDDPEVFIDLTTFTLCTDTPVKQNLLENLNTYNRFIGFYHWLERKTDQEKLLKRLQGGLTDDRLSLN
ncbi:MAG: LON peptidase substrate-binding domain-containing protein [Verrucomicrobiota bacterium]|nr:LON peptidase substrate-binding domain-containing protein [Verrucomicrobiota bacterium]